MSLSWCDEQTLRTRRRQAYSEETQLMELLADEEADEDPIPDDGELEGSGDDFEYWCNLPIFVDALIMP